MQTDGMAWHGCAGGPAAPAKPDSTAEWQTAWRALLITAAAAGAYTLLSAQVAFLRTFPILSWLGEAQAVRMQCACGLSAAARLLSLARLHGCSVPIEGLLAGIHATRDPVVQPGLATAVKISHQPVRLLASALTGCTQLALSMPTLQSLLE